MSLVNAKCTSCGRILQVEDTKDAWICNFCGSPFVVEKAIKRYYAENLPAGTPLPARPPEDTSSPDDFKIAFGVLKKYTGNSKYIVIPEGVTEIESVSISDNVFKDSTSSFSKSAISIILPKTLKKIGKYAFRGCSISEINIPDSVTEIGEGAFSFCTELKNIIVPGSVKTIGKEAFYYCRSLSSVVIEDGVETICYSAFDDCKNLTKIHIPNSIEAFSLNSFKDCYMLTEITYPREKISPEVFKGSAWYDKFGEEMTAKFDEIASRKRLQERNRKIQSGLCPDCDEHLSFFLNKCPRCGKKY